MRRWADVLIVAPASANVIAKSSYGIADNFVLSVMRAWDFRKPCVLCPAMNTVMWTHPTTQESLTRLRSWGWEVLGPVEKVLACNDKGNGAMVSVQDIKTFLLAKFAARSPGSVHALTDSNLQLHSMLLNSQSPGTSQESKEYQNNKQADKLKTKLNSKNSTPNKDVKDNKDASPAKNTDIIKPDQQVNQLATSGPALTLVTPTAETSSKVKINTVTTSTPSWQSVLLQQFLLGVGVGVGMMGATIVVGIVLSGFSAPKDLFRVAPGDNKLRSTDI